MHIIRTYKAVLWCAAALGALVVSCREGRAMEHRCLLAQAKGNAAPKLAQSATANPNLVLEAREHNRTGMLLQNKGNLDEAAREYHDAIELCPDVAAYHNNLALALKDMDKLDEAEQEERRALNLKAYKGSYHYNLGIILERKGDLDGALAEYQQATDKDELDPEFHYRLSRIWLKLKHPAETEHEAHLLISLKPGNGSYHKLLADALLEQGKNEDALYEYRRALELNPNGPEAADIKSKIDTVRQTLGLH